MNVSDLREALAGLPAHYPVHFEPPSEDDDDPHTVPVTEVVPGNVVVGLNPTIAAVIR